MHNKLFIIKEIKFKTDTGEKSKTSVNLTKFSNKQVQNIFFIEILTFKKRKLSKIAFTSFLDAGTGVRTGRYRLSLIFRREKNCLDKDAEKKKSSSITSKIFIFIIAFS